MITVIETKDHALLATLNEDVQTLHHNLFPELFKPYNNNEIAEAMRHMLNDPACMAYLAIKNNMPVGYCIFMVRAAKENPFMYKRTSVYIDQVCVLKEYQKTGAGKLLLQKVEEVARHLSINKIELDHWSANTIAAAYFRKNGYNLYREQLYKIIGM